MFEKIIRLNQSISTLNELQSLKAYSESGLLSGGWNASSSAQGSYEDLVILAMVELSEDRTLVAVVVDSKLDTKFLGVEQRRLND